MDTTKQENSRQDMAQADAVLPNATGHKSGICQMSRRQFLLTSGLTTATIMVAMYAGTPMAQEVPAVIATYPRKLIGKLSALKLDEPLDFSYPDEGAYAEAMVVRLGVDFDLTRHGILISGQAYQSLPQILLELEGDNIFAVGVFGLIFGRYDNLHG
jgi:arsenite oxidase small subunit